MTNRYRMFLDNGTILFYAEPELAAFFAGSVDYSWENIREVLQRDPAPITMMGANDRTFKLERIVP